MTPNLKTELESAIKDCQTAISAVIQKHYEKLMTEEPGWLIQWPNYPGLNSQWWRDSSKGFTPVAAYATRYPSEKDAEAVIEKNWPNLKDAFAVVYSWPLSEATVIHSEPFEGMNKDLIDRAIKATFEFNLRPLPDDARPFPDFTCGDLRALVSALRSERASRKTSEASLRVTVEALHLIVERWKFGLKITYVELNAASDALASLTPLGVEGGKSPSINSGEQHFEELLSSINRLQKKIQELARRGKLTL